MTASMDMRGVGDDGSSICASICLPEVSDELRCLVVSHVACGPASSVAVTAKHRSHSFSVTSTTWKVLIVRVLRPRQSVPYVKGICPDSFELS